MAVYSRKYNYCFFASPQTGSKAITKTLMEKLDGEAVPKKEMKRDGKVIARKHHTTYKMLLNANLLTEDELKNAFKFTGVRNPFDLLVSRYMKLKGRFVAESDKYKWTQNNQKVGERIELATTMDFPAWLRETHREFQENDKLVRGPMIFIENSDFVIKFEQLQAGFDEFLKRIGINESIPVVEYNVTSERIEGGKKRDFREFYDPESIKLVQDLYAPVIERFGYKFEADPVPEPSAALPPFPPLV